MNDQVSKYLIFELADSEAHLIKQKQKSLYVIMVMAKEISNVW